MNLSDARPTLVSEAENAMQPAGPIDCDVHPMVPNLAALFPYLDDFWRETVRRRRLDELNTISYPTRSPLSARSDRARRDRQGRHRSGRTRSPRARAVQFELCDSQLPVRCAVLVL